MTEQPPSADDDLREWFWQCSLNLQNAAIKSTPQIAHPCDADHFADDAMRRVDALIAQRVSAETERWENRDRQRLGQIARLQETVQSAQSASAERPVPPQRSGPKGVKPCPRCTATWGQEYCKVRDCPAKQQQEQCCVTGSRRC